MHRRLLGPSLAAVLVCATSAGSWAQSVVMNSAETIDPGNFKIAAFPTFRLGQDGGDGEWGLAARIGYGVVSRFDIEGQVSLFDGARFFGADAEIWLVKDTEPDVSVTVGLHRIDLDSGPDVTGIDTLGTVSAHVGSRLELYGALRLAFESRASRDFTRVHFVPGIEVRISRDLDLLSELGVGLNDDSPDYFSVGLAFYVH
jgi:hypothetical protein